MVSKQNAGKLVPRTGCALLFFGGIAIVSGWSVEGGTFSGKDFANKNLPESSRSD